MKRKKWKEILKRTVVLSLVFAMIFTTDMGVVLAKEGQDAVVSDQVEAAGEEVMPLDLNEAEQAAEISSIGEAEERLDQTEPEKQDATDLPEKVIEASEAITSTQNEDPCANGHTTYEKMKRATLTADGTIATYCSVCGLRLYAKKIPHPLTLQLSKTTCTYSGKEKCPGVTVTTASGTVDPSNYSVTYTNNIRVGVATATVTFQGAYYKGVMETTFKIRPMATTIDTLIPALSVKGIKVTWNKVASQVSGYQIQYSTSSAFTSPVTIKVSGNSTFSYKIPDLTAGKEYYARVRVYKTVDSKNYYSAWSAAKSVKTYSNDEKSAWSAVKSVLKYGKILDYATMNNYHRGTKFIPYTTHEKIFFNIFKEENQNSYSCSLVSAETVSSTSIKITVSISSKNYSDAVAQGYLKMYADVQASGDESTKNIYTLLKRYTMEEAAGTYKPFTSKLKTTITVTKSNGVWKVKKIPASVENTFTCYADVGLSYAENVLFEN